MKSEFEFIAELKARTLTGTFPDLITGIGDDAAVVASSVDREWLITSDLLVEDTHFSLDFTSADRLGYKALAVNLSDIAAMGGQPKFFLLNIATPKKYTGQFLRDFSDGILTFAKQQNVQLIGGDTSSSKDKLFISITLIGECKRGKAVRRNSAQAGDLVYITGSLGGSALGFQLLKSGLRLAESGTLLPLANDLFASFNSRDTRNKLAAIKAHLLPIPRVELGRVIGERGLASAMIDISDGLSSDLIHICHDSNVGVEVFVDKLPIAPSATLKQALDGGEDYELLFTSPLDKRDEVAKLKVDFPFLKITEIGVITKDTKRWLIKGSERFTFLARGYDHFADR